MAPFCFASNTLYYFQAYTISTKQQNNQPTTNYPRLDKFPVLTLFKCLLIDPLASTVKLSRN